MDGQIPISVTFDGVKNGLATLRTNGGHAFGWPEERLPAQCSPGDAFCLDLKAAADAKLSDGVRIPLAMAMLNEILRVT